METRLLVIEALSPLHAGTGQAVDVIDLPVAREKTTGWPVIPGSSLKGILRDALDDNTGAALSVFGPRNPGSAGDSAGLVSFGDARILSLPVRSYFGTFAWTTCPSVLLRFNRDLKAAGQNDLRGFPTSMAMAAGHAASGSALLRNGKAYLEDLDVGVEESIDATMLERLGSMLFTDPEWQNSFRERFLLISDDLFTGFTETATEVCARIRLQEDSKTVQSGGLWYEEAVPSGTLFWSILVALPADKTRCSSLLAHIKPENIRTLQIGGNASVGRGLAQLHMLGNPS